ncbi:VOC family protein [Yaniella flava]|uniref:VOC family protein n=1 Tax=Yaniella flava TaxID=287930 RepID=A0ABP5FR28_9MICC
MSQTQQLTPHLMFQNGRAEEAMDFYVELFGGEVVTIARYGAETPEMNGKVMLATFVIAGLRINIMDSSMQHEFDLTPSMSMTLNCTSQEQLDQLWAALSEGGQPLMPLDDYGFGPFGWIADSYGVSWQLNYNPEPATD